MKSINRHLELRKESKGPMNLETSLNAVAEVTNQNPMSNMPMKRIHQCSRLVVGKATFIRQLIMKAKAQNNGPGLIIIGDDYGLAPEWKRDVVHSDVSNSIKPRSNRLESQATPKETPTE